MKAYLLKITVIVLFLTVSANSCEKTEPTLPPETQTGEDTFGCYVDGELFVRQRGAAGFGTPSLSADYYQSNNILCIYCYGKNGVCSFTVSHSEKNIKKPLQIVEYRTENVKYTAENTGEILLTRFDLNNLIVSGTFSYDIPFFFTDTDGTVKESVIQITRGRFDIKMYDYNLRD